MSSEPTPLHILRARAPIRICDCGGWTDTWFARYGTVFNIAVSPSAQVEIEVFDRSSQKDAVYLIVENYHQQYAVDLASPNWSSHPLLEACLKRLGIPHDNAIRVRIYSDAPAGASTGTSAVVSVALLGAVDALNEGGRSQHEIAALAHSVETGMLGRQSGIQDQLCSAFGGISRIDMDEFPHAAVTPLKLHKEILWELDERLVLIYLGKSHNSSHVHEQVIAGLENSGPDNPLLDDLRAAAEASCRALLGGDLCSFGQAMIANTEAQIRLHPSLVCEDARRVIVLAKKYGVIGWKVNGAGGEGGSLTLLCSPDLSEKRQLIAAIETMDPSWRSIPIRIDPHGLRVWSAHLRGGE